MDIWGFQKGLNHYYLAFVHEKRREEIEAATEANEVEVDLVVRKWSSISRSR